MPDAPNECPKLSRFDTHGIDPCHPWHGNLVPKRQELAETLTRQFKASKGPYVLSISSGWGTGKSDFLERWQHWLHLPKEEAKPQGLCFRFNAWEYDYTQDPFLAFATALQAFIKSNPTTLSKEIKTTANSFCKDLGAVVLRATTQAAPSIVSSAITGLAMLKYNDPALASSLGAVAGGVATDIKNQTVGLLKEQEKYKTSREAVNKAMAKFGKEVSEAYEGMPLIIMVDELDRCKPSFAVAVLETIKHLFCVKNTVFVLAIEQTQIANCIAKTYGLNRAGAKAYLHKFIDMDIHLPAMDMHTFICQKFQEQQFTLGIGPTIEIPKTDYSFSLPEWIAAITYEILPSCREALQVMNQVAVLSYRNDVDFISLLACACAMSYRAEKHCSIAKAVELALTPTECCKLQYNEKDNVLEYENIFSGLMQSRGATKGTTFVNTFFGMTKSEGALRYPTLSEAGHQFCQNFTLFEYVKLNSNRVYYWKSPCGELWRKQLEEFINFVEPSREEGTPQ